MLRYATIFLIIAIVAMVLGFLAHVLVGSALIIAKICFFVFLALFLVALGTDIFKRLKAKKKV